MREHALDGEMGLAGIGRPEHGGDTMAPIAQAALRRRTEGDGHDLPPPAHGPAGASRKAVSVSQCDGNQGCWGRALTVANESRTKHGRIADSGAIEIRSRPHLVLG